MYTTIYRGLELFILFIVLPVSFLFNYPIAIKAGITLTGFVYILILLIRSKLLKLRLPDRTNWKPFWKETIVKLSIIAVITSLYVFWIAPDKLFSVLLGLKK